MVDVRVVFFVRILIVDVVHNMGRLGLFILGLFCSDLE